MDVNMALFDSDSSISNMHNSSHKVAPRAGRSKKRSFVSKLIEKRRKSQASDADSDFGSATSLQNKTAERNQSRTVENSVQGEDGQFSAGTKDSAFSDDGFDKFSKNNRVANNERTVTHVTSKTFEKEHPTPRSDLHSTTVMDEDEDEDGIKKNAPSDATLHRFRSLKMANDKSDSVDSLKNSPFKPKPPTTPRSPQKQLSMKGEKRNRDPYSSSEEPEYELKSQISRHKGSKLDRTPDASLVKNRTLEHFDKNDKHNSDKNGSKSNRESKTLHNKDKRHDDFKSNNTHVDTAKISDKKSEKTTEKGDTTKLRKLLRNYDDSQPRNFMYNTTDGVMELRPGHKLSPLSPKHPPPPFPYSVSSMSLKTSYKSDPAYLPNKHCSSTIGSTSPDNVSQRFSMTSNSGIATQITTREARSKDGHPNIIKEEEELHKFFPEQKLHVLVGSWNMGEIKETKESLDDFLLPESSAYMQEIYAIGTQENNLTKKEWEVVLQATLGRSHVLFHSVTHGSLHLAIFIRRDLIWYCSIPEEDQVTLRAVTMVKTKGAVAVCFMLFGTSILFINSHFTSDDEKKKDRISDYLKIIRELKVPKFISSSGNTPGSDCTAKFDCVFWCGDLNFRIDKGRTCVEDLVSYITSQDFPNFEDLLRGDQLTKCLMEGTIFGGFQEGRINFKPTYKFDLNTDNYDTSHKNRIPSYTDRILFRAKRKNSVVCLHYDSVMSIKTSDHRPVLALFEALLKPGGDHIPTAGGQFDRSVYMAASKRQVQHKATEQKNQKSSSVCSVQ